MTPDELALIERAIDACQAGPSRAADRILLFPQLVDLVTSTVRREAMYRREHRIEIRRRMQRVRELVWKAKDTVDAVPLGGEYVSDMVQALTDLLQYLQKLEDTL